VKKLKKIKAACAVLALWYISQRDEDAVLRICRAYGFKENEGMYDEDWQKAAEQLGIKMRSVSLEPCRLSQFIKDYPNGLYLMSTRDHLFVVDNGIIFDPRNKKPPGVGRIIYWAWRVGDDT